MIKKGNAQSLRSSDDPESVAGNLSSGECFGLIEILVQRDRILSIKAVTELELLCVSGQTLAAIIDNDARVVRTLLRAMTEQWTAGSAKIRCL